ncbi:MAG: COX15/CtaA family protein [Pseudomonadota bacterium]
MAAVLTVPAPATPSPLGWHRRLSIAALLLSFCVVGLGAYVRLSDAGLGCPDWPGCYGHLVGVPASQADHAAAALNFPGRPVEAAKAWKEMIHRYLAGTLGLLVLALTVLAWRQRIQPLATSLLAGVVTGQALLGMWTVTLLLKPVIVTAHLLGGMATLAMLTWLALPPAPVVLPSTTRRLARLILPAVVAQIALGGWVSSNYAALACTDFPTCQGSWWPTMDFPQAFTLLRELGQTGAGDGLPFPALTAMHWSHRLWAVAVVLLVGALAWRLLLVPAWRRTGLALAGLLLLQAGLGVANVLFSLPLALAVAHTLGAALLLAVVVTLGFRQAG